MKKSIFLSFILLLMCSTYMSAQETITVVNEDGVSINYKFNSAHTAVFVRAVSKMASGRVVVPSQITVGQAADGSDIVYPVEGLGYEAFYDCTQMTEVELPNSLTYIDSLAFEYCSGLSSVRVPSSVTTIAYRAFKDCSNLSSVDISNGTIGSKVFLGCRNLVTAKISANIGEYAFQGCSSLKTLQLQDKVNVIGSYAFKDCTSLSSVVLSSSVDSIGDYVFDGCTAMESLDLGNLRTKGSFTVNKCTNLESVYASNIEQLFDISIGKELKLYVEGKLLTSVIIPEGVKYVRSGFEYLNLDTVSLPKSMESMRGLEGTKIKKLFCYATTPPQINSSFAEGNSEALVFVPRGTKEQYWKIFKFIIEMPGEALVADTVTVAEAGGLQTALAELENTDVRSLVVKGPINAADIAIIRARQGRLSSLEELDLKDVTLVPGDEPYAVLTQMSDGSWSAYVHRFYISTENKDSLWSGGNGIASSTYEEHYCNNLAMAFYDMPLRRVVLPAELTEIGWGMFSRCSNLESVEVSQPVTAIGDEAFYNCENLLKAPDLSQVTSLGKKSFSMCKLMQVMEGDGKISLGMLDTIPEWAFFECMALKGIHLQEGLTTIGEYAFDNSGLTQIHLPSTVNSIAQYAFAYCPALETVDIPDGLKRIHVDAFNGTPWFNNLPEIGGVKYAGNVAMKCDDSQNLVIREGTIAIADGFYQNFRSGSSLATYPSYVELPTSLRYIGTSAFQNAPLSTVAIPEAVEEIAEQAFYGCSKLVRATLPSTLKVLGRWAFSGSALEKVNISGVESIGEYSFSGCSNLMSVEIGQGVRSIGCSAFKDCITLQAVKLPEGLDSIGKSAFSGCKKLKEIKLPESIRILEDDAFYGTIITEIELPENLESFGNNQYNYDYYGPFRGCQQLTKIVSHVKEPFGIAYHAFENSIFQNSTLYVPRGTKDAYSTTNYWSLFVNIEEFGDNSAVEGIYGDSHVPTDYFNIGGIKGNGRRGLNIVRYKCGKAKKVLTK